MLELLLYLSGAVVTLMFICEEPGRKEWWRVGVVIALWPLLPLVFAGVFVWDMFHE